MMEGKISKLREQCEKQQKALKDHTGSEKEKRKMQMILDRRQRDLERLEV